MLFMQKKLKINVDEDFYFEERLLRFDIWKEFNNTNNWAIIGLTSSFICSF